MIWKVTSSSNMIIMVMSKIPQIITNVQNKSTGQLSFFTFLLNFLGGIARLGTVIFERGDDLGYVLQFLLSVGLNAVIVVQFLQYWNSPTNKVSTATAEAASPTKTKTQKRDKLD